MSELAVLLRSGGSAGSQGLALMGTWVFVCGPSGAGKDSVIAWARERLAGDSRVVFARRLITRPAQPGSDHEPVTPGEFDALLQRGQLAWHWRSHGFDYGIPRRYARQAAWDRVVVINGSRGHLAGIHPEPGIHRVRVEAPADRLAARLHQRGRDSAPSIEQRLARNDRFADLDADLVISNDGELCQAGERLLHYLQGLALKPAGSTRGHSFHEVLHAA
jgi:ribose 1,5-bisphosphokinase